MVDSFFNELKVDDEFLHIDLGDFGGESDFISSYEDSMHAAEIANVPSPVSFEPTLEEVVTQKKVVQNTVELDRELRKTYETPKALRTQWNMFLDNSVLSGHNIRASIGDVSYVFEYAKKNELPVAPLQVLEKMPISGFREPLEFKLSCSFMFNPEYAMCHYDLCKCTKRPLAISYVLGVGTNVHLVLVPCLLKQGSIFAHYLTYVNDAFFKSAEVEYVLNAYVFDKQTCRDKFQFKAKLLPKSPHEITYDSLWVYF